MDKNEIHALISLLEDPDQDIYFQVRNKLVELGIEVIPDLENAWEMNFDSLMQSRAEQIIHEIQFNFTQSELKDWISSPEKDLLKAWLLLSHYQYPDLFKLLQPLIHLSVISIPIIQNYSYSDKI